MNKLIHIKSRNMFTLVLVIFSFLIVYNYRNFIHKKYKSIYLISNRVDYWLEKLDTPENNRILMNADKINEFNSNIVENNTGYMINFNNFDDYYNIRDLKEKILKSKYIHSLPDKNYLNLDNIKGTKDNLTNNEEEKIKVSYAVIVNRTNLRIIPTNFKIFPEKDKLFHFDSLQQKELKYGEGVVVLHHTVDKKWVYVKSNNAEGWVENEFLASTDKDNFLKYVNMKDFLVVVSKNKTIDGKFLDMGVKIKLKGENELFFNVLLPEKDKNGNLIFIEKTIEKDDDFNKGFLNYTRLNVIKQSFKYINEDYGWGGLNNTVDCSGLVNNVFSTFGFVMARNSKQQQMSAGKSISVENKSNFIKNKILNKTPAGSLLYMNGHIMIYLGKSGKKYFVIHSVGGYYKNKNVVNIMKVIITDIDYKRKNGETFKKSLASITDMEY